MPADPGSDPTDVARYLDLAARAAWRAVGDVEPNPLVGAVIVHHGAAIGVGHHRRFGGPHAEREALEACARRGADVRGATMYVTLEPCNTAGKQPPCVDALIAAGIARVVCARRDPTPGKGGGAQRLGAAGVRVEFTDSSPNASWLAAPFVKNATTDLPWVIAKWAQRSDGTIAGRDGEPRWISGERSRRRVHRLRARVDAVVTGVGTVLADDPMLDARGVRRVRRRAVRVILDTALRTPLRSRVVATAGSHRTIIAHAPIAPGDVSAAKRREHLRHAGVTLIEVPDGSGGVDLGSMLRRLRVDFGVHIALLEAGPRVLGSALDADLVDQAVVYVAPGRARSARSAAEDRVASWLAEGRGRLVEWRSRTIGPDREVIFRRAAPG